MGDGLNFLMIGDSGVGKSTFIKNFCTEIDAGLLEISGNGQTTRSNGIYKFVTDAKNPKLDKNVSVRFYSGNEFVEKHKYKIIKRFNLFSEDNLKNLDTLVSISRENIIEKEKITLDKIESLYNKDLISDEFIKLSEFGISEKNGFLISEEDNIKNSADFEKILEDKLFSLYTLLRNILSDILVKFKLSMGQSSSVLRFKLNENTSDLLIYCIKNIPLKKAKLYSENLRSLSGLVKNIEVVLPLQKNYTEVCEKIGINQLTFLDTYGLDRDGADSNEINKRLDYVLNYEFKEIDSVIFVAPMVGKAPNTSEKFKALIKAKRSLIPQMVYTKFDIYLSNEQEEDLDSFYLKKREIYLEEFENNDLDFIKSEFSQILFENYNEDVAEYRIRQIFDNISYFMGTYEEESNLKLALTNNLEYFAKILVSSLKNKNFDIGEGFYSKEKIQEKLIERLDLNKDKIKVLLEKLLQEAQLKLFKNLDNAFGRTPNSFWKRIEGQMFGFYNNNLDLQNILIESYINNLAFDSGTTENLGSILINGTITENNLNIFIREAIYKFGNFFFCTGCKPCDKLDLKKSHLDYLCNTSTSKGYRRIERFRNCYHFRAGETYGSIEGSGYCTNAGILGVGILDTDFGENNNCLENCFWNKFFNYYNKNNYIDFSKLDILSEFMDKFVLFVSKEFDELKNNFDSLEYLEKLEDEGIHELIEKNKNLYNKNTLAFDHKKKYILLTEGITDKRHIELAYKMLKNKDTPFAILNMRGADKALNFVKSCPPELLEGKTIIALFDYDTKGYECFTKFLEKKSSQRLNNYVIENYEGDRKNYVVLLPNDNKDIENYLTGSIEFLYDEKILLENGVIQKRNLNSINKLNYVKQNREFMTKNDYEKINEIQYFEPKDREKTRFINKLEEGIIENKYDKNIFSGFKKLFNILDEIMNKKI